jgi:ADP-ribose pyrophosphatase
VPRRATIERVGAANLVYSSRYGVLYDDKVLGATGREGSYLRWAWSGAGVVVVPTDGQRLYLWPMYRYPIGAESMEFPRGAVENGESVTDAAARELSEETGFIATSAMLLGQVHADTGLVASSTAIVLAQVDGTRSCPPRPEATEAIAGPAAALTAAELSHRVRGGGITCALTIAAFVHAMPHLRDR